ncbi:MAG: hypothetical protein NTW16_00190 [Bacteroidetes bacterium]|nr:hypothetical protein [Bacteroidota bacterium]
MNNLTLYEKPIFDTEIIDLGINNNRKFARVPIWNDNINTDTYKKLLLQYNTLIYLNSKTPDNLESMIKTDILKWLYIKNIKFYKNGKDELVSYIKEISNKTYSSKFVLRKSRRFFYNEELIMMNHNICSSEALKYFKNQIRISLNKSSSCFESNISKIVEMSKLNKNILSLSLISSVIGKTSRTTIFNYKIKIKNDYPEIKILSNTKEDIFLESIENNKTLLELKGTTINEYLNILNSKGYKYTRMSIYNYLKKYPEIKELFIKKNIVTTSKEIEKEDKFDLDSFMDNKEYLNYQLSEKKPLTQQIIKDDKYTDEEYFLLPESSKQVLDSNFDNMIPLYSEMKTPVAQANWKNKYGNI